MIAKPATASVRSVYLIRHGSTDLNQGEGQIDRIRGWSNIPLSPAGQKEADAVAAGLRQTNIGIIFTSDLDRAVATANPIAAATGAKVVKTPLLRPWNLGTLTGKPSTDVHSIIVQLATKTPNSAPPSGESFNSFKSRAFHGIRFALASSKLPIALVSHHRLERLVEAWVSKGQPPDQSIDFSAMFQKGDPPSHAEKVTFNLASLGGGAGANVTGPDCIRPKTQ